MPTIRSDSVKVVGLDEALRALKKSGDAEKLGLLKDVFHEAAKRVVAAAQRGASTRMEAAAARALFASKTQRRAQVLFPARRGFEFGAEFGALHDVARRRTSGSYLGFNQFRPPSRSGYFLFPALKEETPQIAEDTADEIVKIFGETR